MNNSDITATKLREISQAVDIKLDPILNRLLAAAEAGEEYFTYYDNITRKQREELTKRGFTVIEIPDKDLTYYKIAW